LHNTLAYGDVLLYLVTKGPAVNTISFGQTVIEILNVCCDLDLEHSNPIFSLDTLAAGIYHQKKFGCKIIINSEDIVKTVILSLHKPSQ